MTDHTSETRQHAPVLSEGQQRALKTYVRLMRAADTVTTALHQHLAEHRLTISQFGVLEALYHLGPVCQKELGAKILKSGGNVTLVIDNLEKRDLVRRIRDEQDRRRFIIALTDAGHRLIAGIFPTHAAMAEQAFSGLSAAEIDALGGLLRKLGTGVAAAQASSHA